MKTKAAIVAILIVLFAGWSCDSSRATAGPATVAELLDMDLTRVKKVIVTADDPDLGAKSRAQKYGFIIGTGLGFKLAGFRGDIEVRDVKGRVIGGVKDGNRYVRD